MDLTLRLRDDLYNLRRNYRNGKKEKTLENKRDACYLIKGDFPLDTEIFDGIITRVHQQLDRIPRPRSFLEEVAYNLGKNPVGFFLSIAQQ